MVWGVATVALVLLIELAEGTNAGLREDLGEAAALIPRAVRQLAIAVAQVAAVARPARRRWRASSSSGAGGARSSSSWRPLQVPAAFVLLDRAVGVAGPVRDALDDDSWLISTRFPSPSYLAAAAAATIVGKPWLTRAWRRSADRALLLLVLTMIVAGTSGLAELLLAVTAGSLAGAAVLVAVGAPNRRPSPLAVAEGLRRSGLDVTGADASSGPSAGGPSSTGRRWPTARRRSSRCTPGTAATPTCSTAATARCCCAIPATTGRQRRSDGDVEHEGLLLLLARRGGVRCPELRALTSLPDGSMVVAMERRRRAPARHARSRRDRMPSCSTRCGGRRRRCTPPASPTGRCGRRTSSSPTTVR